ncbi:hypothetical protein NUZ5A_20613 [Candidatus Nitrosotenuis uzonensis]|uniref:Uncharacterized protein n=1 Tax=Candidatus Nitrosotenuis uzonensis TaxID=1407055 RepID=A0A812F3C9_9ARCH|nr:hypothetical protein NUZ5A_20613 [Candidatus Nitrosotenuis uzonensis]
MCEYMKFIGIHTLASSVVTLMYEMSPKLHRIAEWELSMIYYNNTCIYSKKL